MARLETLFRVVVVALAALAVIGALALVVVWEVCAIRRTLADHRVRMNPPARLDPSTRYWREHSAVTIPERQP
jgi:hypothetical protein